MSNNQENQKRSTPYNQIVDTLSIVFLHSDTIQLIKKDDYFAKAIIELINLCYSYEKANKKIESKTSDFVAAYQSIKNKTIKPKVINIDDDSDVLDKLNYLKIILVNNHKIIWDDLVNSLSEKKSKDLVKKESGKKKVDAKNETTIEDEKVENKQSESDNTSRTYQNSEDFLRQNNISFDNIADNIIKQQATMMLNKDIIENRFYQFDSKPKAFKLSKFILYGFWILFFAFLFVIMGLTISLSNNKFFALTTEDNLLSKQYIVDLQLGKDVFFIQKNNMLFSIFLTVFAVIIICFFIYREIRNFKNDNIQYSFNSMYSWLILMFALFQVLFPLMLNPNGHIFGCFGQIEFCKNIQPFSISMPYAHNDLNVATIYFDNISLFKSLNAYYIINILLLVLTGVILIGTVALMIIKPKLDVQRINQKIQEYYEDIKSGKIHFDGKDIGGLGGFFGRGKNLF